MISQEYWSLPADRWNHYQELGRLGTVAWRQNKRQRHAAFGKPLPKSSSGPPVSRTSSELAAVPTSHGELVATVSCKFERGLKAIVSEQKSLAKKIRGEIAQQDEMLKSHGDKILSRCPSFAEGSKSDDGFFGTAANLPLAQAATVNEIFVAPDASKLAAVTGLTLLLLLMLQFTKIIEADR